MKIKIKKLHPNAVIPAYAKPGDAGMDLTAINVSWYDTGSNRVTYDTGLSIEIPEGYVGLIFPRSSIYKTSLLLNNCVGVIDSGYRGPIKVIYRFIDENIKHPDPYYKVGDRVAQLIIMPYPQIEFEEIKELSSTERGEGGFGSTGV